MSNALGGGALLQHEPIVGQYELGPAGEFQVDGERWSVGVRDLLDDHVLAYILDVDDGLLVGHHSARDEQHPTSEGVAN